MISRLLRSRSAFVPLAAAFLVAIAAPPGPASSAPAPRTVRVIPAIGVDFSTPIQAEVRDFYSGGPGASVSLGFPVYRGLRVSAHGEWFRRSGNPDPGMATTASSRLTLVPLIGEISAHALGGSLHPFVLGGLGVVLARERFSYSYQQESLVLTGTRNDLAGSLGAGVEAPLGGSILRLTARAILTGGSRRVLRAGDPTLKGSESARSSLFTISAEFARPFAAFTMGKE